MEPAPAKPPALAPAPAAKSSDGRPEEATVGLPAPTRRADARDGDRRGRVTSTARRAAFDGLGRLDYHVGFSHLLGDHRNAVLTYHAVGDPERYGNVSVERFRRDLDYLGRWFELADLPEVLTRTTDGRKRVAVTFDDAYGNFYRHALPVVRELEVPVTVFVPTGFVDGGHPDLAYRFALSPARVDDFNDPIAHRAVSVPAPDVMTTSQLRELAADEYVTLGSHTRTHPDLSLVSDRETLRDEIRGAKAELEATLDAPVDRFSYPYGRYSDAAVDVVRDAYDVAVTTRSGLVAADDDPHLLPRISAHVSEPELRWSLADVRWALVERFA